MPTGLERRHPTSGVHLVTASCFRRQPLLDTPQLRDCLQSASSETQAKYRFEFRAYVIMPEHRHLLFRPEGTGVTTVMWVLKLS